MRVLHFVWGLGLALAVACSPAVPASPTAAPTRAAPTAVPAQPSPAAAAPAAPTAAPKPAAPTAAPKPAATPAPKPAGQPSVAIQIEPPMGPVPTEFPTKLIVSALNAKGLPIGHVDFSLSVKDAAGNVVFGGTADHEHLGTHEFWVGPLKPGKYTLEAAAQATMDTPKEDTFEGAAKNSFTFEAKPGGFTEKVDLSLLVGASPKAGEPTRITFALKNPVDGKPVVHTDNSLQIYRDGVLVYQSTNLHSHMGSQTFEYAFAEPGKHELVLSSFPTPMRASVPFKPASKSLTVQVGPAATTAARPAPTGEIKPGPMPQPGKPAAMVLVEPPMGPVPTEFPTKIVVKALTAQLKPIGHVDFDIAVRDAAGKVVFSGTSLHEHSGLHEFWVGPLTAGRYNVSTKAMPTMDTPKEQAEAIKDGLGTEFQFDAKPGGFAEKADLSLSVGATPKAGQATKIDFALKNPADGKPLVHSDNYLNVYRDGLLVYQSTNLHSHMGNQALDYVFSEPGEYTLNLSSFPTPMRASVPFKPLAKSLTVQVAPGAGANAASQPAPAAKPAATPASSTAGRVVQVGAGGNLDVTAKEMEFNASTIEAPRGTKVTVNFANAGRIPHNFTITGLNQATANVDGGKQATLEFTADRAGEYEFLCSIPGHKEAGMVGKFIVR